MIRQGCRSRVSAHGSTSRVGKGSGVGSARRCRSLSRHAKTEPLVGVDLRVEPGGCMQSVRFARTVPIWVGAALPRHLAHLRPCDAPWLSSARTWRRVVLPVVWVMTGGRQVRRLVHDRDVACSPNPVRPYPIRRRVGGPRETAAPTSFRRSDRSSGPTRCRPIATLVGTDEPALGGANGSVRCCGGIPDTYQPNMACFSRFVAFLRVRTAHIPARRHRVLNSCGAKNSGLREK
jgi:hypothetical protein